MAYANVDSSRTWRIPEHAIDAPQIVEIAIPTNSTYVNMDFSEVLLTPTVAISSTESPTETGGKTITFGDESVSPDGKMVSFSVSGMAVGDYEIEVEVLLSEGTSNNLSGRGLLRVV